MAMGGKKMQQLSEQVECQRKIIEDLKSKLQMFVMDSSEMTNKQYIEEMKNTYEAKILALE